MNQFPTVSADPFCEGSLVRSLVVSSTIAHAMWIGGSYLANGESSALGAILIVLMPFVSGFVTGLMVSGTRMIAGLVLLGTMIWIGLFMASGMEAFGLLIILIPLLAIGLGLGAVVGAIIRQHN